MVGRMVSARPHAVGSMAGYVDSLASSDDLDIALEVVVVVNVDLSTLDA